MNSETRPTAARPFALCMLEIRRRRAEGQRSRPGKLFEKFSGAGITHLSD